MLRSDFCDYSDGYGVVKERISVTGTDNGSKRYRKLTFKYNELIRSCIWKINNTFTENAEDLDIVMPMYNLLEYSDTYSGSSWNYYRDKVNDDANENNAAGSHREKNNKTIAKSLQQVNLLSIRRNW